MEKSKIIKEWELEKSHILSAFNVGQHHLLIQNGSVTMTADQQRHEGELNCRDAQVAVEKAEKFFLSKIND